MCAEASVWGSFFLINSVYQCHFQPIYFSSNMFFCSFSQKTWRLLLHKHAFLLVSSKNMTTTLTQSCFSAHFQKKHDGNSCTIMFFHSLPEKTWRSLLHYHVFPLASRKNMTTTLALSCFSTRFQKKHDGHSCISMFSCLFPKKAWWLPPHMCVFLGSHPKTWSLLASRNKKTEKIYVGFTISCMKAV